MPKLREVCRYVRSKAAGPFWVTIDVFFDGSENFERYGNATALRPDRFAELYGVDPATLRIFPIKSLNVVKISYPRQHPQGWRGERDMHAGQQYVRLLDHELN